MESVEHIIRLTPEEIVSSPENRRLLTEVYRILFPHKPPLCSYCLGKVKSALDLLSSKSHKVMIEKKARLKDNQQIRVHGDPKVYNNSTMTDSDAVRILSKFPGLAKKFDSLPDMPKGSEVKPKQEKQEKDELKAIKQLYKQFIGKNPPANMKRDTMEGKIEEKKKEIAEQNQLKELRGQYRDLSGEDASDEWTRDQLIEKITEEQKAIEKLTEGEQK